MKILHVVPSLGSKHGGVSTSVRELCRGLAHLGVGVDILTTPRGHDPLLDDLQDASLKADGVQIQYCPVHPWNWLGQGYAYSPTLGAALREAVPSTDLVHIHAMWLYPTLAASRACQAAKIPYVLSPCGALDPYGMATHPLFKWLYGLLVERGTLRGASAVHFTSELEQRQAQTFGLRLSSFVVPRPIQLNTPKEPHPNIFLDRYPEAAGRRIILFLGRLHAKKRPDLVAEAFVSLANRRKDVHLVMAGQDQGTAERIRQRLMEKGLLERATFPGFISGEIKRAAYAASSLFVLPSYDENFGVSVLEAMASGVPVLVSPSVGIAESVAQAQAGLVVEGNANRWADAMEQLLDNPELARKMGQGGQRLAAEEFGLERVASSMRMGYERLLKPSQKGSCVD